MKKLIAVAALSALLLTGCASTSYEVKDVAKAKAECHQLGGKFYVTDINGPYQWSCDLSDPDEKGH